MRIGSKHSKETIAKMSNAKIGKYNGSNNPHWKGEKATYCAFHKRIEKEKGQPKKCEVCGTANEKKKYHWANLTGDYNNPNDYKRMCVSCHRKYDHISNSRIRDCKGRFSKTPRDANAVKTN